MTENNQKIENMGNSRKPSGKRRAIVKGAVSAVPLVLTLRSGAAFAAASTGSCITRDNETAGKPGTMPATLVNNRDGWLRRTGFCKTLTFDSEIFDVYNTESTTSGWRHISNTPAGELAGTNKTYTEKSGAFGDVMCEDGLTPFDPGYKEYAISNPRPCLILVQISHGTDGTYGLINPASFEIGTADPMSGINGGLPHIMSSCWTSIDPTGVGANPVL